MGTNEVRTARMAGAQRWPHRKQGNRSEHQECSGPTVSSPGGPGLAHCPASTNFFMSKAFVTPAGTSLRPPGSWEKRKSWFTCGIHGEWDRGVARGARPGPQATPLHQAPCAAPTHPQYNTSISFWAGKATGATQTTSGSRGCWPRGQTSLERQPGRSRPRGGNLGSGCRRGSAS